METYIMQQFFGKIRLHRTALGNRQIGGNQRQVDCVWGSTATPASRHDVYGQNSQRFAHLIGGQSTSLSMIVLFQLI
jgi:hypothetical protein